MRNFLYVIRQTTVGELAAACSDENTIGSFLDSHEVITGTEAAAMVNRFGDRIRQAVETNIGHRGQKEIVANYT